MEYIRITSIQTDNNTVVVEINKEFLYIMPLIQAKINHSRLLNIKDVVVSQYSSLRLILDFYSNATNGDKVNLVIRIDQMLKDMSGILEYELK